MKLQFGQYKLALQRHKRVVLLFASFERVLTKKRAFMGEDKEKKADFESARKRKKYHLTSKNNKIVKLSTFINVANQKNDKDEIKFHIQGDVTITHFHTVLN
ncbi:hypothetical protein L596_023091 [Steinernema carpocapsae]|uniref:Uncharacterized protein n=1 Tax=Steinernema carpocapsae TaxID=34508 RepID=A0A4U5MCK8_STECR|nr:hypothetical protein L596_023091 [Steinernema carpocapsae]